MSATQATKTAKNPNQHGGRPRRQFDLHLLQQMRAEGLSYRKIALSTTLGEGTVRRALRGRETPESA